jgi:hypothetical protein
MPGKQTTEYEEWEEIGTAVSQVDHDVTVLLGKLNSVPKSVWQDEHEKAYEAMSSLKDVLEERMAEEHPDEWETDVFYGEDKDPYWK